MTRYLFRLIILATLMLICAGPALAANHSSNSRSKDCQTGKKIIFVSSGVLDADILLRASAPDVLALRFDPHAASLSDLLENARKALNGAKADSIGFAVHDYGSNKFYLTGSQTISLGSTLASAEQRAFWQELGEMIEEQGRIDILACNLAAGQNGKLLMAALKGASGREVAASTDKTGNPAQGGNWFLETGGLDVAGVYFDARGLEDYTGLLLSQEQKLTASDGAAYDFFGFSVSLSGDGTRALVGAKGVDDPNSYQGAAYVFDYSGSSWIQSAKLTASDGADSDFFGFSVSLSDDGTRALIGAYYKNGGKGAAYVFDYSGSPLSWSQSETLTASDGAGDSFGWSVSLSDDGTNALIGAYYAQVEEMRARGATYVFSSPPIYKSVLNGDWSETTTWNQSTDGGVTWTAAKAAPDESSAGTTIKDTHTVTVNVNTTTDQTTVEAGAELLIASGSTLTIANGNSIDLTVQGSLINEGTLNCEEGSELLFSGSADTALYGEGVWNFKTLTLNKDASGTKLDVNTDSDVTVDTELNIIRGTVDLSGWEHNLLLGGALNFETDGRWLKQGNSECYVQFKGDNCTFSDRSSNGPQNLGKVWVD